MRLLPWHQVLLNLALTAAVFVLAMHAYFHHH